jgi:hypothetical protein
MSLFKNKNALQWLQFFALRELIPLLLYIYGFGKISLELRVVCRNAYLA